MKWSKPSFYGLESVFWSITCAKPEASQIFTPTLLLDIIFFTTMFPLSIYIWQFPAKLVKLSWIAYMNPPSLGMWIPHHMDLISLRGRGLLQRVNA